MFKVKQQYAINELDEQSLKLVCGGTGEAVSVATPSEDDSNYDIFLMPIGGTKLPPP